MKILMRAWKGPFDVRSAKATLARNRIGNNVGNLIFSNAAHRILLTSGTTIETMGRANVEEADRINEEFDVYVVPLASAFRLSFEDHLIRLTELIQRLKIPVVVFGVGAQAGLNYDAARLSKIDGSVKAFVGAVLDRGPSIGVRGEFTQQYLNGLGFKDVEVIGCPSMFMYGDALRVEKRVPALTPESKLSINVSPYVKKMGPIVVSHHEKYPDLTYVAQDIETLRMLLTGDPPEDAGKTSLNPIYASHPLFQERKVRFFLDPWPWMDHLRERDFAFGTRIHGNITALVAGTPSFVLAHDSRTLELARYFEIPHRTFNKVPADIDAATLYEEADYTGLNEGHKARFAKVIDYLESHGLSHVFQDGQTAAAFDDRLREISWPGPVTGPSKPVGPIRRFARRVKRKIQRTLRPSPPPADPQTGSAPDAG